MGIVENIQALRNTLVTVGDAQFELGVENYFQNYFDTIGAQLLKTCGLIPSHIAFCMDGNRRFAQKMGLESGSGHVAGFANMIRLLIACHRMGVKEVTVYAFSIENFNRSPEESQTLFGLVRTKLWDMVNNRDSAMRQLGWRVRFPGHRSMLEKDLIERMEQIEEVTGNSNGMVVNVCAPYTTRDDIAHAIATSSMMPSPRSDDIENNRYLSKAPALDMFIRTSGESRLSDFMCWEINAACVVEFIPELWPELSTWRLYTLILKFQQQKKEKVKSPLSAIAPCPPRVSVSKKDAKH